MNTVYTIAGFYAAIGSVWALYVQHANRENPSYRTWQSVTIGLLWPVTLPLCLFLAWHQARMLKREIEAFNRAREEARTKFNDRAWYETDDPEDFEDFWNGS